MLNFSYNYLGDYMKFAFLVSFLAGISTVLGSFVLFVKYKSKDGLISKSLSFASGVMIAVSVLDLVPNSVINLSKTFYFLLALLLSFLFLILGIILSLLINKYLPNNYDNTVNGKLYKVGIFSMLAIILHNIPEGIATFLTASENMKLGITLAVAIALHNIPEGISISVPIYFGTKSKFKAILYTFISGISEFLGAILAFLFLSNINSTIFVDMLYSLIAGIMISLSIEELIPNACCYSKKINVAIYVLIGVLFMSFVHFIA